MKKILSLLTTMIAIAVLFTACSKSPDKLLDRKDGKWEAVITSTTTIDGVVDDTDVEIGTFIFNDRNVTLISSDGSSETGTWSANKDQVTLVIDGTGLVFDVVESKKKEQEWEMIEKETYQGAVIEYKIVIRLTR